MLTEIDMAIQRLEVHGYRSFENAVWEPGKLNLLVGPNGSGKSNLLRLLELISETARGRLSKAIDEAGGMVPLLWNQEAASFGWRLRLDPVDERRDLVEDAITVELDVGQLRGGSAYVIRNDSLGNWRDFEQRSKPSPLWIYERDVRHAVVYDQQSNGLVPVEGFKPGESLLSQLGEVRTNPIPIYARRLLEDWRVFCDVEVGRDSPIRLPVVTQPSTLVDTDGSNLTAVLHTLYEGNREFRQLVNEGMAAAFGPDYERLAIQAAAAQRVQLAVQWRSSKQPHAGQELSHGTLRFLFLLTVLANPDPGPLIAIDEPETGLHPSMLPIVAEYAVAAAERTQVVLSSHSPEFLDAFTAYRPDVTVCQWEAGRSSLVRLPSDKLGDWLEKYRLGRLFTGGELDMLTMPGVETDADVDARLRALPPETMPIPMPPANPEAAHG